MKKETKDMAGQISFDFKAPYFASALVAKSMIERSAEP